MWWEARHGRKRGVWRGGLERVDEDRRERGERRVVKG